VIATDPRPFACALYLPSRPVPDGVPDRGAHGQPHARPHRGESTVMMMMMRPADRRRILHGMPHADAHPL
jgi:hypothetical protein